MTYYASMKTSVFDSSDLNSNAHEIDALGEILRLAESKARKLDAPDLAEAINAARTLTVRPSHAKRDRTKDGIVSSKP